MKRRFALSTDPMTVEEEKALKEALAPGYWWHWLPNFWLIADKTDTLDVERIRSCVQAVNKTKRCFVTEVNSTSWAALTRKDDQGRDMGDWLHKSWTPD